MSWADFDLDDRTLPRAKQLEALRWLREHDPIHWDAKHDRWLITRHADVRRLAKDDVHFTNGPKGPWHSFETDSGSIENLDGAPHVRARNLVSRGFTPRRVSELERLARRVIDEAIDTVEARGHCDLVADLAVPVPSRVIAQMLGIARDDLEAFSGWCDGITEGIGAQAGSDREARSMQSAIAMATHLGGLIAERRDRPGPDVLSTLIEARDEGAFGEDARLAEGELLEFAILLVMGGNETTRNAIAGGMLALFDYPDELERLRKDRSLMPTAVDEVLRYTTVVRALRRWVAVDTDFGGQRFEAGQSVVMSFTSANRDERVFDTPDAFRVDRSPNEHLSFGFGAHYCLGASLARMEIAIVLDRLLTRLPQLRLAPGAEIQRGQSGLSETLLSVPVEF